MWIPLRSAKMNGRILGFQRRVWWPKWTTGLEQLPHRNGGHGIGPPVGSNLRGPRRRGPGGGLSIRRRGTVPVGPVARVSSVTTPSCVVRAMSPLVAGRASCGRRSVAPSRSGRPHGRAPSCGPTRPGSARLVSARLVPGSCPARPAVGHLTPVVLSSPGTPPPGDARRGITPKPASPSTMTTRFHPGSMPAGASQDSAGRRSERAMSGRAVVVGGSCFPAGSPLRRGGALPAAVSSRRGRARLARPVRERPVARITAES